MKPVSSQVLIAQSRISIPEFVGKDWKNVIPKIRYAVEIPVSWLPNVRRDAAEKTCLGRSLWQVASHMKLSAVNYYTAELHGRKETQKIPDISSS
jgi:hypothetical protein